MEEKINTRITANSTSLMEPLQRGFDYHSGANSDLKQMVMHQSTRTLPTKRTATNADYQRTQINILPVIGSEVSLDNSSTSALSRINSKVELTRKDIQNFLVNGSISKEFIQTNKRELQKFIKKQGRSTGEYFRGYEEYGDESNDYDLAALQKSRKSNGQETVNSQNSKISIVDKAKKLERAESELGPRDLPQMEHKHVGSATVYNDKNMVTTKKQLRMSSHKEMLRSQRLDPNKMVFPNDVKVEKKFKGDTAHVSNRVLETWINETLTDAYHLEIPGVLTMPEHKNLVHHYGIDRVLLHNSGISDEEIDRIYRSLFVYSVGFFELLKKILSTTKNNYQIITSIWKVYQVLLEYCCKTDYRILIAEITNKHQRELMTIEKTFKEKIQRFVEKEKVLNQNMETLRDYNDQLEKDRAQEKHQRLKLEEEYMQHTKNHEEEVKLRLKFEGKFNTMHDTHRELQIRHERTLVELR